MANIENVKTKATKITLCDGVERELRFTLNAMAEMEDRYGSVENAFKALEANSIKAVRFTIWAGLLDNGEGLTEQQVGSLIDVQCMEEIIASIHNAMASDMPAAGESLPNA